VAGCADRNTELGDCLAEVEPRDGAEKRIERTQLSVTLTSPARMLLAKIYSPGTTTGDSTRMIDVVAIKARYGALAPHLDERGHYSDAISIVE
jgi:hypothetical protein